ncbi:alkaline phosphatase family protein [bacterium]|nr:alkaline phosphatase family protein [bacterium]
MTTAPKPSFWSYVPRFILFLTVPLLVELIVYLLRPEIFPAYLPALHLLHSVIFVCFYYAIFVTIIACLLAFLQWILSSTKILPTIPAAFYFMFYAMTLNRLMPTESGFSLFRIIVFVISLIVAALFYLALLQWSVSKIRMWIAITIYVAISAFLLQHLFRFPYPFIVMLLLHPLLAFGLMYFPAKLLIAVVVFFVVLFIRGKTVLQPFSPPVKQQAYDRVIVVGVDALSPNTIQELRQQKKLPAIDSIYTNGVHGRLSTLNVPFSPLVWNTIYTGTSPQQHGVTGFTFTHVAAAPPFLSLWLDNWTNSDWSHHIIQMMSHSGMIGTLAPANALGRRRPTLWNFVNENNAAALVIGGWTTFPPEKIDGTLISDYAFSAKPGTIGVYYPIQKRIDELLPYQPETGKWPRYMHRYISRDMKVHHLAMNLLHEKRERERFIFTYYSSTDAFGHHYGREIGMTNTANKDRVQYLIWRNNVYKMIDRFLQDYLALIDDRTLLIVCSDHGFNYDKRQHNYAVDGTVLLYGKGVRKNLEIRGDVYAIAPTVLYALGMPPSTTFSGQPLKTAFEGSIPQPQPRSYSFHPEFMEVSGPEGLDEEKLEELRDLQYIQR